MNKYTIFVVVAVVIIAGTGIYLSHALNSRPQYGFIEVKPANVVRGISTNGTVQAGQNVSLSFQGNGTISSVPVQVGNQVKIGRILASLNARDAGASVDQANAAVAVAQANYQKVLAGATNAQTAVAQATVTSAQTALANANNTLAATQTQQATAVQNAYNALLNTSITAVPGTGNVDSSAITVSGTYTGTIEGVYNISLYATGGGTQFHTLGLEEVSGNATTTTPTVLGTKGLYIQFSSTPSAADTWTVTIPNTFAPAYVPNYNAYQAALQTQTQNVTASQSAVNSAKAAEAQAEANLQLTQSAARPEDVAAAKAQIDSARANLETALSTYSKTRIIAPFNGTVTEVEAKVGQTATAGTIEISMISAQKFQAICYVSEADLGKINLNDAAQITTDAYGSAVKFPATVAVIDPKATIVNNVSGYKITLQFTSDDARIKDGLSANIAITDKTNPGVLAVPASALFTQNGTAIVLKKNQDGTVTQQQVQTGITGLDNMVEITSGLNQGDQVIYFGK
ncbi:MAG: efflux RND transporter periplasmic adaptor subunit [Candidatus Doudnabacteria bacterium]